MAIKSKDKEIEKKHRIVPNFLSQGLLMISILGFVFTSFPSFEHFLMSWIFLVFLITALCLWDYRQTMKFTGIMILGAIIAFVLYARFVSQEDAIDGWYSIVFGLLGFSVAVIALCGRWPRWLLYVLGYLALFPFFYGFFIKGIDLRRGGDFFGMNRNMIPRFLFMTTSLVLIIQYLHGYRLSIVLPGIVVFISFLSRSRAGLLISSGLFVLTLVQGYLRLRIGEWVQRHKLLTRILMIMALLLLVVVSFHLYENSRLKTQGLDSSGRVEIHLQFIKELTPKRVLFGFRPEILDGIGLHSTYYTWLAFFGIFSLIIIVALTIAGMRLLTHRLYLFGILTLWMVYSTVETLSPFAEGDVVLVLLLSVSFSSMLQTETNSKLN